MKAEVDPKSMVDAVYSLKEKYPRLTFDGLDTHPTFGTKDVQEVLAEVLRWRPIVQECIFWLRACLHQKGFNHREDTYRYKHECEKFYGHWIPHSAMLVAIEIEGLEMQQSARRPWAGELKLKQGRPGQW